MGRVGRGRPSIAARMDEVLLDVGSEAAARLGRPEGDPPQYLTLALLADYGVQARPWWPSGCLVRLLAGFGVSESAARAALSRLGRHGVLETTRSGRTTAYRLTAATAAALAIGGRIIARFAQDAETWDGRWTMVAFAQAGDAGQARRLRDRLRWLGYAPAYDGLWVSPRADADVTAHHLDDVRPAALTVFRAETVQLSRPGRHPLEAWDLDAVASAYRAFIAAWGWVREPSAASPEGAQAVVSRVRLLDGYRRFARLDPQVPERLMPAGWPRREAREVFLQGYDGLGERAEAHVRAVLDAAGVAVPPGLARHTVQQLAEGLTLPRVE